MDVPGKYLLAFAACAMLSVCTCKVTEVAMDGAGCGVTTILSSGDEANLKAAGSAPGGNCSTLVHVDKTCIGLRVSLIKVDIPCTVTLLLSGLWFDLRGNRNQTIKCNSQPAGAEELLFRGNTKESSSLKVDINEFAAAATFNISIKVQCEKHEDHTVKQDDKYKDQNAKLEVKANRTRAEGIAVGVCLACLFLIILLITYCYYKNRPYRGSRHDYPSAKVKKGKGFSGFKAKFSLNRHKEGDTSPEKTKEEYRKKDSPKHSHETLPLVAAAAATATLDETLNTEPEEKKKLEENETPYEPTSTPEIKVEVPSQPETPSSDHTVEPTVSSYDHDSGTGGGYGGGSSGGYGGGSSGGYGGGSSGGYGGGSSGGDGGGDSGGGGGGDSGGGGGSDD